jgi:hypothetical protein
MRPSPPPWDRRNGTTISCRGDLIAYYGTRSLLRAFGSVVSIVHVRESRRVKAVHVIIPHFGRLVCKRGRNGLLPTAMRGQSQILGQSRRSNSLLLLLCSRITLILRFGLLLQFTLSAYFTFADSAFLAL